MTEYRVRLYPAAHRSRPAILLAEIPETTRERFLALAERSLLARLGCRLTRAVVVGQAWDLFIDAPSGRLIANRLHAAPGAKTTETGIREVVALAVEPTFTVAGVTNLND